MLSVEALKALTITYQTATGISSDALSQKVLGGHNKFFKRLLAGCGYLAPTGDHVMRWFSANWPEGVDWPAEIPRPVSRKLDADQ
jgi:hypothetical protein